NASANEVVAVLWKPIPNTLVFIAVMLSMSLAACKPLCRLAKFPTAVSRPNREVSIFQAKQGLVPRSHHGRFIVVPTLAGPFRHSQAKEPLNPSILPGYFGKRQATSQTGGE